MQSEGLGKIENAKDKFPSEQILMKQPKKMNCFDDEFIQNYYIVYSIIYILATH